eukprot:403374563
MASMQFQNQYLVDPQRSQSTFLSKNKHNDGFTTTRPNGAASTGFSNRSPEQSQQILETKKLSKSFLNLNTTSNSKIFDQSMFQVEQSQQLNQYKNIIFYQKQDEKRKQQLKDIKIKKFEKVLEAIELKIQNNQLDSQQKSGSKKQSQEEMKNEIVQINQNLERQKMGLMLRKRLKLIQKYKNIELMQEERLKNMFEHLRQLDNEIREFIDDDEIIKSNNVSLLPEKVLAEQMKIRETNHHNMKLLEYDLSNIHTQVQRDLELVLDKSDLEILSVDPRYLSEQVKSGIHDSIDNLHKKVHTLLSSNYAKYRNQRTEKFTQTESWDFAKFSDNIESLTRQNALLNKDMKWIQTKLDRAIGKEAEKDGQINSQQDRIEKLKEQELDYRKQIQEKEQRIREMKILLQQKDRDIQDLENQVKDLEKQMADKDSEYQKMETSLKSRLQQSFQQNMNQARINSKSPAIKGGRQNSNQEDSHSYNESSQLFSKKKPSNTGRGSEFGQLQESDSQDQDGHKKLLQFGNRKPSTQSGEKHLLGTQIAAAKHFKKSLNASKFMNQVAQEFTTPQLNSRKLLKSNIKKIPNNLSKLAGVSGGLTPQNGAANREQQQKTNTRNRLMNFSNHQDQHQDQHNNSQANSESIFQNQYRYIDQIDEDGQIDEEIDDFLQPVQRGSLNKKKKIQVLKSAVFSDDSANYKKEGNHEEGDENEEEYFDKNGQNRREKIAAARQNKNRSMIDQQIRLDDLDDPVNDMNESHYYSYNSSAAEPGDTSRQSERKTIALRLNQNTGKKNTIIQEENFTTNQVITEESIEQNQNEDKHIQTHFVYGIDKGIQAFEDDQQYDYQVYNQNFQVPSYLSQYNPVQRIKVFKKVKISGRVNMTQQNSPQRSEINLDQGVRSSAGGSNLRHREIEGDEHNINISQVINNISFENRNKTPLNQNSDGIIPKIKNTNHNEGNLENSKISFRTSSQNISKQQKKQESHYKNETSIFNFLVGNSQQRLNFNKARRVNQSQHFKPQSLKPDENFERTVIKGSGSPFRASIEVNEV